VIGRHFEVRQLGPITEFLMGPTVMGRLAFPFRAYLVDGLLIDTGPPSQQSHMAAVLREFKIDQVVNTHHHEDHAGNNALIIRELGITPQAHPLAIPVLANLPPIQLYRRISWGQAENAPAQPLGATVRTPRYEFQVHHTPGHADDHVVLYEPNEGWLFGGDLFIGDKHKLLRPEEDPFQMMSSLESTLALGFDTIFCAHRGRVDNGKPALARKHAYMVETHETVQALHTRGLPEEEIVRRIFGKEDWFMRFFSQGDFSRKNLVEAFLPGWNGPFKPQA
jgi:glyoxylase-like metal-dependent hydrolase (beta-lactamase superfamily II)